MSDPAASARSWARATHLAYRRHDRRCQRCTASRLCDRGVELLVAADAAVTRLAVAEEMGAYWAQFRR